MENKLTSQDFDLKSYFKNIKVIFFDAEGTLFQYEGNVSIDSFKTTTFPKRQVEPYLPELLELLYQKGYKIGTMSNYYYPIVDMLRELKIDKYIEFPFCFNNLQLRKPSLESYQKATELCEFPNHEILMIGDNLESDYYPAEKVGWKSLLYCSAKTKLHDSSVRKISGFNELLRQLRN